MRDTRAELLSRAEILVRGRGYSGFSYADLAAAVGIRKASIHHHFRTKDALALALVAAYAARYEASLVAIAARGPDGLARIDAYGRLYLGGVEQGLGCLCAVLAVERETLPDPLRAALSHFFEEHIAWLERALAGGIADGSIRQDVCPSGQARLIVAALEGALLIERMLAGPAGFEITLAALRDGLRPPGAGARPSPAAE